MRRETSRNVDRLQVPAAVRRGLSLVEVMFVVAILGVVAVGAIALFAPNLSSELEDAAQVVTADVERARNLAVANNSKYKLTFNSDGTGYYVQHSGTNSSLNTLPSWPYKQRSDSADRNTTLLKQLPGLNDVDLIGVVQVSGSNRTKVDTLEFTSLGAASSGQTTEIWLAAGTGDSRRYMCVTVNPTTGLSAVGDLIATAPTVSSTSSSSSGSGGSSSGSGSSGLQISLDLLGVGVNVNAGNSGVNAGVETGGLGINLGLGS